jgi:hypothetical protein
MVRRFRNITGEDRWIISDGRLVKVVADGVVEVRDDNYWQPHQWREETKSSSPKADTSEGSK